MLNYIWFGMIVLGFFLGVMNGRTELVTKAALDSAGMAIELCIGLLGVMCLWTGLMAIAEKSGLIKKIANLLKPAMRILFPEIHENHKATGAIIMNLVANFLGLGNAATPLGLKAMTELQKTNLKKETCTDSMCMFLVLNTSAIQLIPSTIIALRSQAGSSNSTEIIGAIWITSLCANITGIISVKIFSNIYKKRGRNAND